MKKKIVFLFPGQGSQYSGMGLDIYKAYPSARAVFEEADSVLGFSLSHLIFEGSQAELTLTKNSQVAIFVVSMALLKVLQEKHPEVMPTICAGLSLGEYTALCAAGKISFSECLKLVRDRGLFMQEAAEKYPGSLSAVMGLEAEEVEKIIEEMHADVWVANLNCPKQVVISGTHEGLKQAEEVLKAKGAKRVLPLDVSGAFHSGLMKEAQEKLKGKITLVNITKSSIDVVMNVPGEFVRDADKIRENLILQVASPTRWEKGIRLIDGEKVDFYLEIGCGRTLSGMNKKIGTLAPTYQLETLEDFEKIEKALLISVL